MNLLIVEDQSYIKEKIKEEARKINIFQSIQSSENLREAFKILKSSPVDVITLDLSLPDGSGLEILSHLRDHNIQKKVFVFSASPELERVALRYGADSFFDKNNGLDPLIDQLRIA